jgi:hypothetical protein
MLAAVTRQQQIMAMQVAGEGKELTSKKLCCPN